jgi:AcrR family transcriptional regulator
MAGVREKKKARTREAILRSAAYLFSEKGYAGTTIEEVAERAVVGVGTVYNYFGSKSRLLVAVMVRDTENLLRQGEAILTQPGPDPEEAVTRLLGLYAEHFWVTYGREVLREVPAIAFADPESLGREMLGLDFRLVAQISDLLTRLQQSGAVDESLPVAEASLIVYTSLLPLLLMYFDCDEMSPESMRDTIRSNVSLIFRNWRRPVAP